MKTNPKKERDYGEAALKHVRRNQLTQLPTIKPKTPEWTAWQTYFVTNRNFPPYIMQRIEDGMGGGEMTVPAELPEHFDTSYARNPRTQTETGQKNSMSHPTKKPLTPRFSKLTTAITQANPTAPKNYVPFHKRKNLDHSRRTPHPFPPQKAAKRPISLPKLKCLDQDNHDQNGLIQINCAEQNSSVFWV